jgi:NAD-dependent dihydropyrimidine dehydrogenase PreA subunit
MIQQFILCQCAHRALYPAGATDRVANALAAAGIRLTLVEDLCGCAADKAPVLKDLSAGDPPAIIACYPRAVQWLLHAAGTASTGKPVRLFNLRTRSAEAILKELGVDESAVTPSATVGEAVPPPPPDAWVPWFPVLDYDRCVHCRQCVSFCPFGVYSVQDGKVLVTAPRNCKDNCPACARMCPRQAIIFPKVPDSPINGDEVTEQAIQEARQRLEEQKKALEEEDLHSVLAKRKLRARLRQS